MMRLKIVKISALALTIAGCSNPIGGSAIFPRVLLEIEYINLAFVPAYHGVFIDDQRNVTRYNRNGVLWDNQNLATVTREQLDDKWVPIRNIVDQRPISEITNADAKIKLIDPNALSARTTPCNDAGTLTYRAWVFNLEANQYTPILLRVEGDVAQQNTSPAAQDLIAYIRSLNLLAELSGCDP